MVYSLGYRRPPHVTADSARASLYGDEKPKSVGESTIGSQGSGVISGIPEALSFDRIISGGTCPPCTTRDFMNYLIYIEHAAENLQFFLWYKDYAKRFTSLPSSEQSLAPMWTEDETENKEHKPKQNISPETAAVFKGTDFAPVTSVNEVGKNPFNTPPRTPRGDNESMAASEAAWSEGASTLNVSRTTGQQSHHKQAADAFETADLKWQPFTIQPFREEIARIIASYVADGGPRQLNLSSKERQALLHALTNTTHPSAFRKVVHTVEWSLRHQAHPNFIRWTICNGNRPRVVFARGLGVATISLGIIAAIIIILSGAGRAWRAFTAILFVIGIATLIAAWKGMCVVLHGMHHRHLRPWELFASPDDESSTSYDMSQSSFDTLGTSNSYEDEPWVARYDKRNLVRKVFDREVWIQEPALRQIQDTIFLQAMGGALLISAVCVGIFVAIPGVNLF
ncbi:uncharacterized protein KY384_006360 [Bacidia gigantensis]|uniref:uncharacterized protein n=1 Tax=Bacidia gigantensis TaxID=2732470 RepID=UPI001D0563BE|nr:uncharacterized protein KY384_006360 [Bacidia gigantensis]KAG8528673.1 hypothetical protein KY384_006360 [Bacidia gigantensis]